MRRFALFLFFAVSLSSRLATADCVTFSHLAPSFASESAAYLLKDQDSFSSGGDCDSVLAFRGTWKGIDRRSRRTSILTRLSQFNRWDAPLVKSRLSTMKTGTPSTQRRLSFARLVSHFSITGERFTRLHLRSRETREREPND